MIPNLVEKISADFAAAHPDVPADFVNSFTEFAKNWLDKKQVIGVGQTTDGFAIRFADLSEAILSGGYDASAIGGAVSISGAVGRSDRTVVDNSSFGITGR